jgi:pimeloyl-ACP methyl ester carboxylesterase
VPQSSLAVWTDRSPHREGTIRANGVDLNYLEWGGPGPTLILIHGLGDNPHIFDDIAPSFSDRYRVIAYARRGHGLSEHRGPFSTDVLTEDLKALMDGLGIAKASLACWSMGGIEATAMAARYPERVEKVAYLEAAYDWSDPAFDAALKAVSSRLQDLWTTALATFEDYLAFNQNQTFTALDDMCRVEAYLRQSVIVESNGGLRSRTSKDTETALYDALVANAPPAFREVHCPVLAVFSETMMNVHAQDDQLRLAFAELELKHMAPFRENAIRQLRHALPDATVERVSGTHSDFLFVAKPRVVSAIQTLLDA